MSMLRSIGKGSTFGKNACQSFCAVLCFTVGTYGALTPAGNVVSTAISADRVDFVLEQGAVARVEMLDAGVVRVRLNPTGQFTTWLSGAISTSGLIAPGAKIYDNALATYLITQKTIVTVVKNPFQVVILRPDHSLVTADLPNGVSWDSATGLILDHKFAPSDEHYFGMGERGGPLDRRGRIFNLINVDWAAYGEYTDPLYISIPFFFSLRGGKAYGLFLDNPAAPFFDFDSARTGTFTLGARRGELDYYAMVGPDPAAVATSYAQLTGFMHLPPKWALGYHQSRYGYSSEDELLQIASTFRQLNIPCDALYLDINYMDALQQLTWDPLNFPSPQGMNIALEQGGFKRVNIVEPLVRTDDRLWPYLAGSGFFLTNTDGTPAVTSLWYGNVSWIDYSKDGARQWYKQALQMFLAGGVSGIWNDLNEPAATFMPNTIYNYNGQLRSDLEARDLYALQVNSLTYEALSELRPNERPWGISRSGYSGIQRYTANWSGDTTSSFDSLRVSVQMSNHMGLSGQSQFGHDIGGFLGSPSAELFMRWLEFASYTPLFRNHAMNTSLPREPWMFGEPYTSMARNVINQRYQRLPYLYTLDEAASRTGQPVVAPAAFYFPGDPQTYTQDQELMLGNALLVAPVVQQGATSRNVYLPAGASWVDVSNDVSYAGGQQIVAAAPLDRIPVFAREGAILPQGPVKQYVSETADTSLAVDFYPGPDSSFTLYEDDGNTLDYTRGVFLRTTIARQARNLNTAITINRTDGTWIPPGRSWFLYLHRSTSAPSGVQSHGLPIPSVAGASELANVPQGWFYDSGGQRVVVRVPDSPLPVDIIVLK